MRWIAVAAGVLLVASLVGSEEQAAEEESPLIYTLEVNGEPYPIEVGKLLTLPAHEGLIKVRLKVAPYRIFRTPGVEFRFPRGWHLERRGSEYWILMMRGFRLYVSMDRGERDAAKVMEDKLELRRRLANESELNFKVIGDDRSLRLAGNKVAGTTYYWGSDDSRGSVRTSYALRTGPDTVVFTFSELRVLSSLATPSEEWKEMERWLQESLKVLPASGDK